MQPWSNLANVVYKRTYSRPIDNRLENWGETVERVIGGNVRDRNVSEDEVNRLRYFLNERKAGPAGRGFWYSGSPGHGKLGGAALNNCYYFSADDYNNYVAAQDLLMLGGGVGISVEHRFVSKLPKIKKNVNIVHLDTKDADFIIPDSREGWNELTRRILECFFETGKSFSYSTVCIRGAGEPIKGFGGVAGGAGPLITYVKKLCHVLAAREGKHIKPIDAADILCCIGEMVVSGNVRRSAIIILGDAFDKEYLKAKRWDLGNIPTQRAMANFSVICDDVEDLHPLFWQTYEHGEPFGIVNRTNIKKYGRMGELKKDTAEGVNPSLRLGTKVLTTDGIMPIEQLEGKSFKVKNLNGEISEAECWLSGKNKPLYEVLLASGQKYYATAEHKWPILCNGRFIKLTTEDLISGDELPVLKSSSLFENNNGNYKEGFVIGWLYGDGWVTKIKKSGKTQYGFIVSKKDQESGIHNIISSYLSELTGIAYKGCAKNGNLEFNVSHEKIDAQFLKFGVGHKRNGLPTYIWTSSEQFRKGFVDGLISSDGSVSVGGTSSVSIKWSSSHEKLCSDFSELLGFYGLVTNRYLRKIKNGKFPNKKNYNKEYTSHVLTITNYANIDHFRKLFTLSIDYKQSKLLLASKDSKWMYKDDKGKTIKIVSIIKTSLLEDVWDIRVLDKTHCFQISHCITGNCGEATLESNEACNLQELALPSLSSIEEFEEAGRLMHRWGKRVSQENYHNQNLDEVVKRNRRIGTGITGCLAAPQFFNPEVLDRVYAAIQKENVSYSKELGINESIRTTVIKPSGTWSKLMDVAGEGIHSGFSRYMIQRVRIASNDPLIPKLKEAGHHIEPVVRFDGTLDHNTQVVDFYIRTPDELPCADEGFNTWKQLDTVLMAQKHWADQAVSVTVYYKKEEIPEIKNWLSNNLKNIKTISFLCHSDHGFIQAPKEAISEDQYDSLSKKIKPIDISELDGDKVADLESLECASGSCPIK